MNTMCAETSPRVSFSQDPEEPDIISINESRRDLTLLENWNSEFEFNTSSSYGNESSSSADELFFNGVIIPVQLQNRFSVSKCSPPPTVPLAPLPSNNETPKRENEKGNSNNGETATTMEEKPRSNNNSKSFWGFKRSSSLNCDIKKSLICSLPLLSRSNSTGSPVPGKKTTSFRETSRDKNGSSQKQQSQSKSAFSNYQLQQKPPLKKSSGGGGLDYHRNAVKIGPVLNIPPPYISKGTADFFGLSSFLRSGSKDKNKK